MTEVIDTFFGTRTRVVVTIVVAVAVFVAVNPGILNLVTVNFNENFAAEFNAVQLAPGKLSALCYGGGNPKILLSWNAINGTLQKRVDSGVWVGIQLNKKKTTLVDGDVARTHTYSYRIRKAQNSFSNTVIIKPTPAACTIEPKLIVEDTNPTRTSPYLVGDTLKISVLAAPNQDIKLCYRFERTTSPYGTDESCSQTGKTDLEGKWESTQQLISGHIGNWTQWVIAGKNSKSNEVTYQVVQPVVTMSYIGPLARIIAPDEKNVSFVEFVLASAKNVEIKTVRINIGLDINGDGLLENLTPEMLRNGIADINNIRIEDAGSGAVIAGPMDGIMFTESDSSTTFTTGSSTARYVFTDRISFKEGGKQKLRVLADILSPTPGNGLHLGANSKIALAVTLGDVVYSDSGKKLLPAEIIPAPPVFFGPLMTIADRAPTPTETVGPLSLALDPSVGGGTMVKGSQNVKLLGVKITDATHEDIAVDSITIKGYYSASGNGNYTAGCAGGSPCASDVISSIKLYTNDDTPLAMTPSINNLATDGTVVFSGLSWNFISGQSRSLYVVADMSTNNVSGYVAFDVQSMEDSGSFGLMYQTCINGCNTPVVATKIVNEGILSASLSPSSPSLHTAYWGQQKDTIGVWRLTAKDEGFFVDKITFGDASLVANVKELSVRYKNRSGTEYTRTASLASTGKATFGFVGVVRPFVPADSTLDMTITANYKTETDGGATNGTSMVAALLPDSFHAVGLASGTIITAYSPYTPVLGSRFKIYQAFPYFKNIELPSNRLMVGEDVLRFNVGAVGLPDARVTFIQGNITPLTFDLRTDGNLSAMQFSLRDENGTLLDRGSVSSYNGGSIIVTFSLSGMEILGGQAKTLHLTLDELGGATYAQVMLPDEINRIRWTTGNGPEYTVFGSEPGYLYFLPITGPYLTK